MTLAPEDVAVVQAALERYATERRRLEDEALAGIEALRARRSGVER